ncbi:alpha-crystallin A chain [Nephila pilipes]|uniref:Alpha-crystallin A chain n=1 Tax=Nephila pilipes TaxID=299642 RepID=A0A8X6SZ45_NEPPI|nr:alpha-crystallin A chain [Nephila pilipes]
MEFREDLVNSEPIENFVLIPTSSSTDNGYFESDKIQQRKEEDFLDADMKINLELQRLILDKHQNKLDPVPLPRSIAELPYVDAIHLYPAPTESLLRNERAKYIKRSFKPSTDESRDNLNEGENSLRTAHSSCLRFATQRMITKFKIYLDCKHFLPSELEVRIIDDHIVVYGVHCLKLDEHGLVEREFISRYPIPEDVNRHKLKCFYNKHGILIIEAPRKVITRFIQIQKELPTPRLDYKHFN